MNVDSEGRYYFGVGKIVGWSLLGLKGDYVQVLNRYRHTSKFATESLTKEYYMVRGRMKVNNVFEPVPVGLFPVPVESLELIAKHDVPYRCHDKVACPDMVGKVKMVEL